MSAASAVVVKFKAKQDQTAKQLGRFFATKLTKEEQDEFASLPLEEQMGLLKVPVRALNRYKADGVWWYVRVKIMGGSEDDGTTKRRGKSTKQMIECEIAKGRGGVDSDE
jgi:hypothetical protein